MKKEFVEPKVRKIAINLKESIADGSGTDVRVMIQFRTIQAMAGCIDFITDTLPNPGDLGEDALSGWVLSNAPVLASCSMKGVFEEYSNGSSTLFAAGAPTLVGGSNAYEVPKDVADAYGMQY